MTNKAPGFENHPEHTVAIKHASETVRVVCDGAEIASTSAALEVLEGTYPPVFYIPKSDVAMDRLTPSAHSTYCPFKGDASYWSIGKQENIVWAYDAPYDECLELKDHVAFYANKVEIIPGQP